MYPNLYYLFSDLFGIQISFLQAFQSFGFMLAISFLSAAWLLKKELIRKEKDGLLIHQEIKMVVGKPAAVQELVFSGLGGFIVGFKLLGIALNFQAFVDDPQAFVFSFEGSWLAGIVLGGLMAWMNYREKEKHKLDEPKEVIAKIFPHQKIADITIAAALIGLLGAKLFDNLEHPTEFMADPIGSLFSFSGLTFYGGLIFGAGYVIYYCLKNKIPVPVMADAVAPALIFAYGVGRIGCQLSGDGDWGIINQLPKPSWFIFPDWAWAFTYPHNVINEGISIMDCTGKYCSELAQPVFPTPLYESFFSIIIFIFLWMIRKKITRSGLLFSVYLLLNGIERFTIEQIRVNVKYHFMGIAATQAEIIAVMMMLLGISGILYLRKNKTQEL